MKRIALVLVSRHITSLGGIGHYVSSFVDLMKDDYVFDLIVDRPVTAESIPFENLRELNIIAPSEPLSYSIARKHHFYESHKVPMEMSVNFSRAIFDAHKKCIYDYVFIQSPEAIPGVLDTNIQNLVPVTVYAHEAEFFTSPDAYKDFGEIYKCKDEIKVLGQWTGTPLICKEYDLLTRTRPNPEPNTAYFCGNWSVRKDPKSFVAFCEANKKKPLVITNATGVKEFTKAFEEAGITDYEIRTNIFGQEKVDFIARGEVCFHPAKKETGPYSAIEASFFMPVIGYRTAEWTKKFPSINLIDSVKDPITNLKNDSNWVKKLVCPVNIKNAMIKEFERSTITLDQTRSKSLEVVNEWIHEKKGISITDYWEKVIKRDVPNYLDFVTLYKIARNYRLENNSKNTYIGNIVETNNLENFF